MATTLLPTEQRVTAAKFSQFFFEESRSLIPSHDGRRSRPRHRPGGWDPMGGGCYINPAGPEIARTLHNTSCANRPQLPKWLRCSHLARM